MRLAQRLQRSIESVRHRVKDLEVHDDVVTAHGAEVWIQTKKKWTPQLVKRLFELVEEHRKKAYVGSSGKVRWYDVARDLGTGHTSKQCQDAYKRQRGNFVASSEGGGAPPKKQLRRASNVAAAEPSKAALVTQERQDEGDDGFDDDATEDPDA